MNSLQVAPLRTCLYCGLEAKTKEELSKFVSSKQHNHGHQNCCLKCRRSQSREHRNTERGHLLKVYTGMIDRCYKNYHKSFKRYGERGIKVCEIWLDDKEKFLQWAIENGYKRVFTLPQTLDGINYTMYFLNGFLIGESKNHEYVLQVSEVNGSILKGTNTIRKNEGVVYMN